MQTLDLDAVPPDPGRVLTVQRASWAERRRGRFAEPAAFDAETWLEEARQGLALALAARDEPQASRCLGELLAFADAMARAAGWGGGTLRLALADGELAGCPLVPLRPAAWLAALQAATLARDDGVLARLAGMPCFELPRHDGERFCLAAGIAWAALARRRPEAAREIGVASALARDPHEQALVQALVAIAQGLPRPDGGIAPEDADFVAWLAGDALADAAGAPVTERALAWRAGLSAPRPRPTCRAPLRQAPWPGEPAWWLDLYAGAGPRTQRLVEDAAGRSVARCRVEPDDGGPVVEADFLIDPQDDAHDAAPALDPGELLHLADCCLAAVDLDAAGDVAGLRAQRAALDTAQSALDAALARLPAARPLREQDLASALGRVRWQDGPARLGRSALGALRARCSDGLGLIDARLAALPVAAPAGPAAAAASGAPAPFPAAEPPADASSLVREAAMAAALALQRQVEPLLAALADDTDGRLAATLKPRADDYAKVFRPDVAEAAGAAFAPVWDDPPPPGTPDRGRRIEAHVCPAGLLDADNPLSRPFPAGYRALAPLLDPHRVWVAWKAIAPGQSAGMAYDGLVWVDDHWAWFPKPYRVLRALVDAARGGA